MKIFSMLAGLLFTGTLAMATELPYAVSTDVSEANNQTIVSIQFETLKTYSAMCHRTNTSVTIESPMSNNMIGIPTPATGLIAFKTTLSAGSICMMATGPHTGAIALSIGSALPAISNGYYLLNIDGNNYGYLVVSNNNVSLIDMNDIPQ